MILSFLVVMVAGVIGWFSILSGHYWLWFISVAMACVAVWVQRKDQF